MQDKVAVCVVTYNQEQYIDDCLRSLVTQQTNFPFKVYVFDDCSTDRTRNIVMDYVARYPQLVVPFFHERNMGAYENFVFAHRFVQATYIAHMDGDDYALPGKLQQQADFLDTHPKYNLVWHRVQYVNQQTGEHRDDLVYKGSLPLDGINRKMLVFLMSVGVNSSKMYRSSCRQFDDPGFEVMDYYMNVEQLKDGLSGIIQYDAPLGCYRVGLGISVQGKSKIILAKSITGFARKYPETRMYANGASLLLLLVELKNLRKHWKVYAKAFVLTFHPLSWILLFRYRKCIRVLRSPF